jgi:anhydro-N-acetylmuramic acid kinase
MKLKTSIGLMSGTSMDGIDVAMVRTDGKGVVERGSAAFIPYEPPFRRTLAQALETASAIRAREERPGNLVSLEAEITSRHAEAVREFLAKETLTAQEVAVVGFHGQTLLHRPQSAMTVQLGDGKALADAIGIPVVYDMRANDMVHGGQGAPLVPAYHAALAHCLPKKFAREDPVAFDSGPGNALIDQWVEREGGIPFDDHGRIGSEGAVFSPIIEQYMANEFFGRSGPKSLDRNDFSLGPIEGMELADGARTLAAVTAHAIFAAADHVPQRPKLWILCGGGRKNWNIVNDLRQLAESDSAQTVLAEDADLNGDSLEAEAWGYLAVRSLEGEPLTYPSTTGCRKAVTGGLLAWPP